MCGRHLLSFPSARITPSADGEKKTWACHEHAHPPVRPSPHPPLRAPLSSLPPHALCEGSDISFFEQCSMATSTTGLCEVHTYYVHVDVYVNVCMYVCDVISRRHLLILSFSSFFSGGISRLGRMGNANAKSPDFLAIVTRFQSGARHRPCTPCRAHCQPPLAVVDSLDWAWGCRTLKWGYCTGVSDHRVLLDTDIHRSCSDAYAHVCVTPPSLVLCWCRAPQTSIPTFDGFPESAERGKKQPTAPAPLVNVSQLGRASHYV